MRRWVWLLVVAGASEAVAQAEPVKVRSCAYADSMIGPMADEGRASILRGHHAEQNATYLVTESRGSRPPRITATIKATGALPAREPAAQLVIYFRGNDAKAASALAGPPAVSLTLDDTASIVLGTVAFGSFEGPRNAPMTIPLSAFVPATDLWRLARARSVTVDAEIARLELTSDERRAVRALTRVAICPQ